MVIFAGVLASVVASEVFLPVYYSLSFTSVNQVNKYSNGKQFTTTERILVSDPDVFDILNEVNKDNAL
jgi:hypothetical protein